MGRRVVYLYRQEATQLNKVLDEAGNEIERFAQRMLRWDDQREDLFTKLVEWARESCGDSRVATMDEPEVGHALAYVALWRRVYYGKFVPESVIDLFLLDTARRFRNTGVVVDARPDEGGVWCTPGSLKMLQLHFTMQGVREEAMDRHCAELTQQFDRDNPSWRETIEVMASQTALLPFGVAHGAGVRYAERLLSGVSRLSKGQAKALLVQVATGGVETPGIVRLIAESALSLDDTITPPTGTQTVARYLESLSHLSMASTLREALLAREIRPTEAAGPRRAVDAMPSL